MAIMSGTYAANELNQYDAIAYYRLSRDDGSKHESDSIVNQRKLIHEYLTRHPNIHLVEEAQDDGYTGTNYDRPGFRVVMEAINSGRANCVIVKDLSRLGREYVETGKYLEMVFPSLGIRFIAINDDVDSKNSHAGDDIIIPVKNLMNESYCRELSKKLRRQFKIQRANGEFIGAFACYGYCKSTEDKHKLVLDEYAAEVVRGIFVLKMKGYSSKSIADYLNHEGILSPAEYKKSQGLNYKSGLKRASDSKWSATSIQNILSNPIYIGDLVQGKRGTPNYKNKKMRLRDEADWVVVENNHEPIVDRFLYMAVQHITARDTRTSPDSRMVFPLSGVLFCADCERAMVRRSVTKAQKKFYYYVCSTNKKGHGCSSHAFEQGKLERVVLNAIQRQVELVVKLDNLISELSQSDILAVKVRKLDLMIAEKHRELDGYQDFRLKLHEALHEELIDWDEYTEMRQKYTAWIYSARDAIEDLETKKKELLMGGEADRSWMREFAKYQNIHTLTREAVVSVIDRVYVFENKRIHIDFNYKNEIAYYQEALEQAKKEVS